MKWSGGESNSRPLRCERTQTPTNRLQTKSIPRLVQKMPTIVRERFPRTPRLCLPVCSANSPHFHQNSALLSPPCSPHRCPRPRRQRHLLHSTTACRGSESRRKGVYDLTRPSSSAPCTGLPIGATAA